MSTPFRQGRMPCRKARPRLTNLPGRMPGKRQAGCRFLLGTSLLDKQKRSTSGREADRNALDSSHTTRPERRASRTGYAPTGGINEVPTLRRGCQGRRWKPQGQNALFAWQMLADGCRSTLLASLASATGDGGQVLWRRLAGGCRLAEFSSTPSERMAQRR